MYQYPEVVLGNAHQWVGRKLYDFTELEERALRPFFTNTTQSVFLMHTLPQAVGDVLLAMYSRIKNPRGLRGVFVDNFLPQFLGANLRVVESSFGGDVEKFLKTYDVTSLNAFYAVSDETRAAFVDFLEAFRVDPNYIQKLASTQKVKKFLTNFLDKYGHNSIARMAGGIWICFEQISILAAKSIEWGRPGVGYIELSTRYSEMSTKGSYPIAAELAAYGVAQADVDNLIERSFESYRMLSGEKFDGPFPQFMRDRYGHLYEGVPKDLEAGVIGETCDVLGNFLPAATLTSVGVCVSGEALPGLVQHLRLDSTPENHALADALIAECEKLGLQQFLRHLEISPWKEMCWRYLSSDQFLCGVSFVNHLMLTPRGTVEAGLAAAFQDIDRDIHSFNDVFQMLLQTTRGDFDKLPSQFEHHSATFGGVMSFRGWRDLQRMGFCTHHRTLLTPKVGFYHYSKPAPAEFGNACGALHRRNGRLYGMMSQAGVPPELMQYPLALGNLVGFHIGANLAQWEFCGFQRTDYSVNHEVREVFCAIDRLLNQAYPWWRELSRADITPAYVFARGSLAIVLPRETVNV